MGGLSPGKETDELVLEDESDAYAGVEASEVGGHGGDREVGTGDISAGTAIFDTWVIAVWWVAV